MTEKQSAEQETIRAQAKRIKELEAQLAGARKACPCTVVEPCSDRCSCAHPLQSGGCSRCCSYGSEEQRKAAARRLADLKKDLEVEQGLVKENAERLAGTRTELAETRNALSARMTAWVRFHKAGFTDLWYANCGPHYGYQEAQFGPRFHAGVWTGPQHDLICVKPCKTNEEANVWLSPAGWSPEEAIKLALELLDVGPDEFDRRYPTQVARMARHRRTP